MIDAEDGKIKRTLEDGEMEISEAPE